jgi:hypothetical protein
MRIGALAAPLLGRFQPSFGAAVLVGLDRPHNDLKVVPGAVALAQLDYFLNKNRGLFLHASLAMGFMRVEVLTTERGMTRPANPFRADLGVGLGGRL